MSNEGGSKDAAVQTGRILLPFLPGIPQELGSSSQVVEADSCQVTLHLTLPEIVFHMLINALVDNWLDNVIRSS